MGFASIVAEIVDRNEYLAELETPRAVDRFEQNVNRFREKAKVPVAD
jgi:hypothetical protein